MMLQGIHWMGNPNTAIEDCVVTAMERKALRAKY
jgi:hypothetical protein